MNLVAELVFDRNSVHRRQLSKRREKELVADPDTSDGKQSIVVGTAPSPKRTSIVRQGAYTRCKQCAMAGRRSFKTDESFLEKLAIGAIGARAVFSELQRQGHKPIELERGSMGYKIWKSIKINRLRVPDILCLNCSVRVEARAKTQLEISMSHSLSDPERGWNKGLTDRGVVALSLCRKTGKGPTDWQCGALIQFVSVEALRKAFAANQILTEKPKGAGEGFELRVTWPSLVASSDGVASALTAERVQFKRTADQRTISLAMSRRDILLQPLVKVGDPVRAGQIIASVVPVTSILPCSGSVARSSFLEMLDSPAVADRYTAAKALSHFQDSAICAALKQRMADDREHIYVRLEAAAGLARASDAAGMEFIQQTLQGQYLEHRLEAVIILGEIPTDDSRNTLTTVLLDLGGAYQSGRPVRSLYNFRVMLRLCDEHGFRLAEEFFWHNPAKLPSPIEWVNKRKIRAKDSVNTVWWFAKTDFPKADVRRVLAPYSERMKKLLEDAGSFYRPKLRPSGHDISANFANNNGGAIPSNLLQIPNTESNSPYQRRCASVGVKPHPARFPEKLPTFFIEFLTDPGDTVLDIFAGSNTTGSAAEKLDRRWMAFEKDRTYLAASIFRFVDERAPDELAMIWNRLHSENLPVEVNQQQRDLVLRENVQPLKSDRRKR